MPRIHITTLSGEKSVLDAKSGKTLMEVLTEANYEDIEAICGGVCNCSTCHVYIEDGWYDKLSAGSEDENNLLNASPHKRPNSRLSCQINLTDELDGLVIQTAQQDY